MTGWDDGSRYGEQDDRYEQRAEDIADERMERALWKQDRSNYPPDLGSAPE